MSLSNRFTDSLRKARRTAAAVAPVIEDLENRMLMSTWYVSTAGVDGAAGSLAAPWKSVQYAVDRAVQGDTVILRGGTYAGNVRINTPGLTIKSAAGEVAKIASPNNNSSIEVAVRIGEFANNVTLDGLDISGGYYYAVKTESLWDTGAPVETGPQYLTIKNSVIHDSGADVIKLTPATNYSVIENNEIYNSGRTQPGNAEGIDAVQANYATVRNNYVHDITTNGIYYKGGSVGTVIEGNRVTRAAYSGILLGQSSDENWFDTKVNPNYYESIDGIVRNNIVWDVQGAGIGAWAALRPQIYNNTLVNVAQSMFGGLLVQGQEHWIPQDVIVPSTDVTMYNNIVTVNSTRPVFEVRDGGLTGFLRTDNNLFYQNGSTPQFWDLPKAYYGDITGWRAIGRDAASQIGNPSVDTNYKLTASSTLAVDKGRTITGFAVDIDSEGRPAGAAYDIGADEFGGVVVTPTPTPTPTPAPTPDPVLSYTPTWTNTSTTAQTGKFELTFTLNPKMANMDMVFGISNGAASAATSLGPILRLNTAGQFDARNGAVYAAAATLNYQAGTNYQVRMVVDTATRTYDAYVTPTGGTAVKIASSYAFRTELASVTQLNNVATFNEAGDAAVSSLVAAPVVTAPVPTTTVPGYLNTAVATQSGKFIMQVTATPDQTDKSPMFGLSLGVADAVADMPIAIRFNSADRIDVRTGNTWSKLANFRYYAGVNYTFKVYVDMTAGTYAVWVNAPGATPVQIAANYRFNATQATLKTVDNLVKMTANGGTFTLGTPTFTSLSSSTTPTTTTTSVTSTVTPVPSTTTDLALKKTAAASSIESSTLAAANVNDGSTTTRWASGTASTAWVMVDLGATYQLTTAKVNWEYASASAYQVQVSNDGVNWTTVANVSNTLQGGVVTSTFDAAGRYVRINCTAATTSFGYSMWSLEVYGK